MRTNLEPKGEVGGSPPKQKSFTDLVRSKGLRIIKSDSNPRPAAYILYDWTHDCRSVKSG